MGKAGRWWVQPEETRCVGCGLFGTVKRLWLHKPNSGGMDYSGLFPVLHGDALMSVPVVLCERLECLPAAARLAAGEDGWQVDTVDEEVADADAR